MKYLLDTHALIWWLTNDRRLSRTARAVIGDPVNRISVSSASAWEISTKHRIGKLEGVDALARDVAGWVGKARFEELPITFAHAERAGGWLQEHRDPFDRMLAAQSELEGLPLVTSDAALRGFGIQLVW